jgi:leader peptidase (prepilin peptidase)/N-methyltransferase
MLAVALFGLVIGSFLNVVIVRLPDRRSLVTPRSACPTCGGSIAWYDNIPLLSFAALGGRCRACQSPISWQYPFVEAATASLFMLAYRAFGLSPEFVVAIVLLSMLVAVTGIDLGHQIIPDVITLPGIVTGVVANLATHRVSWAESLLGIVLGGGIFWIISVGSSLIMRREAMGGGDEKLGAMLGAFLGWKVVLVSIFLAVLTGGLVAGTLLVLRLTKRKDPIPFGPFLALGAAGGLFWGDKLITWYMSGFAA